MNATSDFRKHRIPDEVYAARLEERQIYRARAKGTPDTQGYQRFQCPASGSAPGAACALKPRSYERRERGVPVEIHRSKPVCEHPPKCCRQDTVTLPPWAGAKFWQPQAHGNPEWHSVYFTLRNTIEGANGFIKDGAYQPLGDPSGRRVHGVAAQSLFVGVLLPEAAAKHLARSKRDLRAATLALDLLDDDKFGDIGEQWETMMDKPYMYIDPASETEWLALLEKRGYTIRRDDELILQIDPQA